MVKTSIEQSGSPAAGFTAPGGAARAHAGNAAQVAASFVLLLILWEGAVGIMDISILLLPAPTDIAQALQRGFSRGLYWPHLWSTFEAAGLGFIVAIAAAFPLGVAIVFVRILERISMPYIVALQAMPKIALGPLFVAWMGFGLQSKVAVAALVAFFPLLINIMSGLRSTPAEMQELMASLGASRRQRIRLVLLPNAAPYIFAGMSVSIVFSLLGAIAAEFVGASRGMGILILTSAANFDITGVFAALILLSLMGILMYSTIEIIRRKIVFWVG